MANDEKHHSFDSIASTAYITSFLRKRYSDPGSFEDTISSLAEAEKKFILLGGNRAAEEFALFIAARDKVISKEICSRNITNILELASGLSSRGIKTVCENEWVRYVETDMPEMAERKKMLIEDIAASQENQQVVRAVMKRYTITPLDGTEEQWHQKISAFFPIGTLAIITEGLLPYLYKKDLVGLCDNIYELLRERGGIWITDMVTKNSIREPIFSEEASRQLINTFYRAANINTNMLAFDNAAEAVRFFSKKGFILKRVSAENVTSLHQRAVERGMSEEAVFRILSLRAYFIFSLPN